MSKPYLAEPSAPLAHGLRVKRQRSGSMHAAHQRPCPRTRCGVDIHPRGTAEGCVSSLRASRRRSARAADGSEARRRDRSIGTRGRSCDGPGAHPLELPFARRGDEVARMVVRPRHNHRHHRHHLRSLPASPSADAVAKRERDDAGGCGAPCGQACTGVVCRRCTPREGAIAAASGCVCAGGGGEGFDKVQAILAQRRKVIEHTHIHGARVHTLPSSVSPQGQPPLRMMMAAPAFAACGGRRQHGTIWLGTGWWSRPR